MNELPIVCILLIALVFIMLAIIMAFLYDKYLKKRSVDSIDCTITTRDRKPRIRCSIEEDIECAAIENNEPTNGGTIDEQLNQSLAPQLVNDYTQTSIKMYECSISSQQIGDNCRTNESPKTSTNSPQIEIHSTNSGQSVISSQYLSHRCSPKPSVSANNLLPKNKSISGDNVCDSVLLSGNRNTFPKRMRLSSAHSFSPSDDIILEIDTIIDQSFDELKSTIDCMSYDTLRYSCEDLS